MLLDCVVSVSINLLATMTATAIDQLSTYIGTLKEEIASLILQLAKHEILSNERFETIRELESVNKQLTNRVDDLVTQLGAVTRDRDDALVVVENMFSKIQESNNLRDEIDKLLSQLELEKRVNLELKSIFNDSRNVSSGITTSCVSPSVKKITHKKFSISATQTDVQLVLNKYIQVDEAQISTPN